MRQPFSSSLRSDLPVIDGSALHVINKEGLVRQFDYSRRFGDILKSDANEGRVQLRGVLRRDVVS